jgi:hypothetical protein
LIPSGILFLVTLAYGADVIPTPKVAVLPRIQNSPQNQAFLSTKIATTPRMTSIGQDRHFFSFSPQSTDHRGLKAELASTQVPGHETDMFEPHSVQGFAFIFSSLQDSQDSTIFLTMII